MFKIALTEDKDGQYFIDLVMKLPEIYKKQHREFFEKYNIVNIQPNNFQQVILKRPSDRTCRFCGESYPKVTFKKKAHIIPELLGRGQLVSDFECDNCNQLFSKYETELAYFIGAARSLTQTKAKEGVPKYKSSDKKLEIKTIPNEQGQEIITLESEDFENKIHHDQENKTITIKTDRASFVPVKVYKSLVKILLTLLPEETFKKYSRMLAAIMDADDDKNLLKGNPFCRAMIYVNPGIPFPSPITLVLEKKDDKTAIPSHSLLLYFHNYIYQIFLPLYEHDLWMYDGNTEVNLHAAPPLVDETFVKKFGMPQFHNVNLGGHERIKKQKNEIVLSYTSIKMMLPE